MIGAGVVVLWIWVTLSSKVPDTPEQSVKSQNFLGQQVKTAGDESTVTSLDGYLGLVERIATKAWRSIKGRLMNLLPSPTWFVAWTLRERPSASVRRGDGKRWGCEDVSYPAVCEPLPRNYPSVQ